MRFWTPLTVACVAALALSACANTEDPPPFLALEYQVLCVEGCTTDDPARNVDHLDGEDGYTVACSRDGSIVNLEMRCSGENNCRRNPITASEDFGPEYEFHIFDAKVGADPGSACLVRVVEGANTYEGPCTATEPTDSSPCQLTLEEADDGGIDGSLRCVDLRNPSNRDIKRDVGQPAAYGEGAATFSFFYCN